MSISTYSTCTYKMSISAHSTCTYKMSISIYSTCTYYSYYDRSNTISIKD
jgi:hypothetical protein